MKITLIKLGIGTVIAGGWFFAAWNGGFMGLWACFCFGVACFLIGHNWTWVSKTFNGMNESEYPTLKEEQEAGEAKNGMPDHLPLTREAGLSNL